MASYTPPGFWESFEEKFKLQNDRNLWLATAPDSLEKRWIEELLEQVERSEEHKKKLYEKLGHSAFSPVHL